MHMYINVYTNTYILRAGERDKERNVYIRPTQSIIYVPLLVCVFHKSILIIIRYKYSKSGSKDFKLEDVILRTRVCGTGFIPQHC